MAEGTTLKRIQRMNYDLFIYVQNITHYIVLFMNNPAHADEFQQATSLIRMKVP